MKYTRAFRIIVVSFIFSSCAQVEHTVVHTDGDGFFEDKTNLSSHEEIKIPSDIAKKINKIKVGMAYDKIIKNLGDDFRSYRKLPTARTTNGIVKYITYAYLDNIGEHRSIDIFFDRNGVAKRIYKRSTESDVNIIIKHAR